VTITCRKYFCIFVYAIKIKRILGWFEVEFRACNESSKGLRKRGVHQKKGSILGRVALIAG
jgi:hypothetical protein